MARLNKVGNLDVGYLYACFAMAGYKGTSQGIKQIFPTMATRTAQLRVQKGDFNRKEMIRIYEKCHMTPYDFLRAFFPDLLRRKEFKQYAIREAMFSILTHDYFDNIDEDTIESQIDEDEKITP